MSPAITKPKKFAAERNEMLFSAQDVEDSERSDNTKSIFDKQNQNTFSIATNDLDEGSFIKKSADSHEEAGQSSGSGNYSKFASSPRMQWTQFSPLRQKSKKFKPNKIVPDYYQWPVFFAVLPPLLALYSGGKMEEWAEGFTLLIVAFYLYGLIKLPWELYISAKARNEQIKRSPVLTNRVSQAYSNVKAETIRRNSEASLQFLEWFYYCLVFASPIGGAVFLRYVRPHLNVYRHFIDEFPMALYVLTSYIRPLIHLSRVLKNHAAQLSDEVTYPNTDVEALKAKVEDLQNTAFSLSRSIDEMRREMNLQLNETLETRVGSQIEGLNKDIKRTAKKERKYFSFSEEKFRELEEKISEQAAFLEFLKSRESDAHSFFGIFLLPVKFGFRVASWFVPSPVKKLVWGSEHYSKRPSIGYCPADSYTGSLDSLHSRTFSQRSLGSSIDDIHGFIDTRKS